MIMSRIRKVLLLRKTSRLQYERTRYTQLNEEQFKEKLIQNGSDYEGLLLRHHTHERNVKEIHQSLLNYNIDVMLRDRDCISSNDVQCSDAVIAAGGDGNFLTAASHILTPQKLLIGINTDSERSKGQLCITPSPCLTIQSIIDCLINKTLKYIKRHRISVTINSNTLPVLALNETFIGETDPSQVSYFELCSNGNEWTKYHSSGLLVYTGTGSTSWAYNINKVSTNTVQQLLLLGHELGLLKYTRHQNIKHLTDTFNNSTIFSGSHKEMAYVIRELIDKDTNKTIESYSRKCSKLKVRSRSWNTQLIIDGQYFYNFPNGSEATFKLGHQYILSTAIKPD